MGYKKAATLLNKNGYRTSKKKRWTPKSVANFHYNRTIRSPQKSNNSVKQENRPVKQKLKKNSVVSKQSFVTNLDMIRHILDSNLAEEIKLVLLPLFVSG